MSWIIGLLVGGIVGWLTMYAMSPERRGGTFGNIVSGAIGGVFGIWFFFLALGIATASVAANYWLAILWSIIGAVVLVSIVNSIALSIARNGNMYESRRMSRGIPHDYEEVEIRKRRKDNFDK